MVEYPADWKVITLGSCFDMCAAGDLLKEYFSASYDSEHKWCIYSNAITNAGRYGYTSRPRYKGNALTITGRGTLGHAEYRDEDFDAIIRLIVLTPRNGVDCRFVTYWINFCNPFVRESTSIPQLTVPQVMNIQISLPTLPEQKRIAAVLSNADKLIANVEKRIAKKRAIKQGAMQEVLTGKKRLPGFSGEWKELSIGSIGIWLKGQPFAKSEIVVSGSSACIHYGELFTIYGPVIKNVISKTDSECLTASKIGDVLFPISDVTPEGLGRCSVILEDGVLLGGDLLILRPQIDVDSEMLSYVINMNKRKIIELVTGTTVRHISSSALSGIKIRLPGSLAEQQAIAKVLSGMDAEIANLERKLEKLKLMKQGMMQDLLTGKVRLK